MRVGGGLIGLLLAALLVLWLARPARLVVPPATQSTTSPADVLPQTGHVNPDEFRRALNEAVQSRAIPAEAQ